jgi:hypothetical protein
LPQLRIIRIEILMNCNFFFGQIQSKNITKLSKISNIDLASRGWPTTGKYLIFVTASSCGQTIGTFDGISIPSSASPPSWSWPMESNGHWSNWTIRRRRGRTTIGEHLSPPSCVEPAPFIPPLDTIAGTSTKDSAIQVFTNKENNLT